MEFEIGDVRMYAWYLSILSETNSDLKEASKLLEDTLIRLAEMKKTTLVIDPPEDVVVICVVAACKVGYKHAGGKLDMKAFSTARTILSRYENMALYC